MNKINKAERIRQLALAAELEKVQTALVTAETHLASITLTVNKIICNIIEEGSAEA